MGWLESGLNDPKKKAAKRSNSATPIQLLCIILCKTGCYTTRSVVEMKAELNHRLLPDPQPREGPVSPRTPSLQP